MVFMPVYTFVWGHKQVETRCQVYSSISVCLNTEAENVTEPETLWLG